MIQVSINGKNYTFKEDISISEAIQLIESLPKRGIAIALNNHVVPSSQWESKILSDGDKITIIKAFYGG